MPESAQLKSSQLKSWCFAEASRVLARLRAQGKTHARFETGYGASGLPHIGTFGEVARTQMVRHALAHLAPETTSETICFSDDMDGLRKVPDNVPNKEMLAQHLERPLTSIPDPFDTHESFGAHNNARLRAFLDEFAFDYKFISATQSYRDGIFDKTLISLARHYEAVLEIILPTLRKERRATYSPFLPICATSGKVLYVETKMIDAAKGIIAFTHPDTDKTIETPITGGACKLQWKADWAMRWCALDIDYEMSGKDLSESVALSARIAKLLGAQPPEGFTYELFLDENGEKISKSRGNGLTIEEWLRYAPQESLSLYMFQAPRKAKRLYFDVIPKATDDYLSHLASYETQTPEERLENPVWHINNHQDKNKSLPLSFSLLINLATASNADNKSVLWGFINNYAPNSDSTTHPFMDKLVDCALNYYHDFVAPHKTHRAPTQEERAALTDLQNKLAALPADATAETLQSAVYEIGKAHFADNLRGWFQTLYQTLLGQDKGPRFGSFIALYGINETRALIEKALQEKF